MTFLYAFLVGGLLCAIGQLLIDFTKLTPARILTAYVVAGVVLGGLGIYDNIRETAGCGATVPLTGFGALMAEGVRNEIADKGFLGIFTGGLTAGAGGIAAAMLFAFMAALFFRSSARS
ncbi:stage V sporulation protein AE [uncultured Ruminococcus sp.]|uniref:stage V sporulation protein AE n=1 Tax=uncultured Ruminococcus sp. TaxID=165186 RepID=UPI000ED2C28C|nr:stage V sporulation protein AE [uncultured Ruminococcus sp.]HCJ42115.1 stage V sporulation protein AE [Ruminococcus sp.]